MTLASNFLGGRANIFLGSLSAECIKNISTGWAEGIGGGGEGGKYRQKDRQTDRRRENAHV